VIEAEDVLLISAVNDTDDWFGGEIRPVEYKVLCCGSFAESGVGVDGVNAVLFSDRVASGVLLDCLEADWASIVRLATSVESPAELDVERTLLLLALLFMFLLLFLLSLLLFLLLSIDVNKPPLADFLRF